MSSLNESVKPEKKSGESVNKTDEKQADDHKDAGEMLPDKVPTVIPTPRRPQHSLTEEDKQRADWEGMTPNKPTKSDEA